MINKRNMFIEKISVLCRTWEENFWNSNDYAPKYRYIDHLTVFSNSWILYKKTMVVTLLLLFFSVDTIPAQNRSLMLCKGKRWNYRNYNYCSHPENVYFSLHIIGDTIIDGTQAMVVMKETLDSSSFYSFMYEENGKIYKYNDEEKKWNLYYNFNLNIGDDFMFSDYLFCVTEKDSVLINNDKRCRLRLESKNEELEGVYFIWTEGVGSNYVLWNHPDGLNIANDRTEFTSIYVDNDRIYNQGRMISHCWQYAFLKNWKKEQNTIYGNKMDFYFSRSDYDSSERIEINGHNYIQTLFITPQRSLC